MTRIEFLRIALQAYLDDAKFDKKNDGCVCGLNYILSNGTICEQVLVNCNTYQPHHCWERTDNIFINILKAITTQEEKVSINKVFTSRKQYLCCPADEYLKILEKFIQN